jgi:hypothetical protein
MTNALQGPGKYAIMVGKDNADLIKDEVSNDNNYSITITK